MPRSTRYPIALRMVGRDTPSRSASSTSFSRRPPTGSSPPSICSCRRVATWKYRGTGLDRSRATFGTSTPLSGRSDTAYPRDFETMSGQSIDVLVARRYTFKPWLGVTPSIPHRHANGDEAGEADAAMTAAAAPDEVLTMGRMGVDIYPLQVGTSLRHVESFGKFLGGSPANVAVAAARLGRRSAVITRTGADPFGEFLHDALQGFGVDDRYVTAVPDLPTPGDLLRDLPAGRLPAVLLPPPERAGHADQRRRARPRRDPRRQDLLGDRHRPVRGAQPRGHAGGAARPRPAAATPSSTWTTGRCSGPPARRPASGSRRRCPTSTWRSATSTSARPPSASASPTPRPGAARAAGFRWRSSSRARRACSPTTARPTSRCRRCRSTWSTAWVRATRSAAPCATPFSLGGTWSGACGSATPPVRSSRGGWRAPTRCPPWTRSRPSIEEAARG